MAADVATTLAGWSATSASNAPSGSTSVSSNLDDNVREVQGVIVRGLSHKGSDIASATSTDIGAVEGLMHDITGTTTITGLGTVRAGIWKVLKFEGALTLTHNATSLILPGAGNITTAAGDVGVFISEGSGNWRCLSYQYATNGAVPPGAMMDFAGTSAPAGWLGCDGSAVSRSTYARLFAAIGTTWGAGDESTTFNLPDFSRRVAVGSGGTGTATLDDTVGSTGGAETHTLDTTEIPSHTHGILVGGAVGGGTRLMLSDDTSASTRTSVATGGGGAHNNLQPSAVVLKIIKT